MSRLKELTGEDWINSHEKRSMDLAYASAALPLTAILGISAVSLSRLIDGEGAIFRQLRIGQHAEKFTITKIRTMKNAHPDSPSTGALDSRATPLGKVLRVHGIDEVPQIFDVLSGRMSAVGPRAQPSSVIAAMEQALMRPDFDEWLNSYYRSKPGLLSSFVVQDRLTNLEGEERYLTRGRLDIQDFKNASFKYDQALIFSAVNTIRKVWTGKIFERGTVQSSDGLPPH